MVRKPSKSFLVIVLAVANLFLFGCNDKPLFIELHSASSESENTSSWDFSQASDYIYDPEKIEFVDGKAQLKQVDQTHEGSDFNSGTYVGTGLSDSDQLTLKTSSSGEYSVNEILPTRTSNLVAYFKAENNWDDSSSSNHGTGNGGVTFTDKPSFVGFYSGKFDGVDDYVELPNNSVLENLQETAFTYMGWVAPENAGGSFYVLGKRGFHHGLTFQENGGSPGDYRLGCVIHTTNGVNISIYTPYIYKMNQTYHVACSMDYIASSMKLFINGKKVSQNGNTSSGAIRELGAVPLMIGSPDGTTNFLEGTIDEVAIFNIQLEESEISEVYNAQESQFTELSASWTPHFDKMVGYWKMDGNWQDSSGSDNHGVPGGGASFDANARVGSYAGSFDGAGDYIEMGDKAEFESFDEVSLGAWVNLNSDSTQAFIVGKEGVYKLRQLNGTVGFLTGNDWGGTILNVSNANSLNRWVHLVATYDGAEKKIFIDGIEQSTKITTSGSLGANSNELTIGAYASGTDPTDGSIDDVFVMDKGLSASEIKIIYNRQKQKYAGHYDSPVIDLGASGSWTNLTAATTLPFGKEIVAQDTEISADYTLLSGSLSNGLEGYWNLNEPSGTSFVDNSGMNRTGTSTGTVTPGKMGILKNSTEFTSSGNGRIATAGLSFSSFTGISMSIWAKNKSNSISSNQGLIYKGLPVIAIQVNSSSQLNTEINTDASWHSLGVSSSFNDWGDWHHIAVTYDGANVIIYRDGVPIQTVAETGALVNSGGPLIIGVNSGGVGYWNGWLDEASLWSRALSSTEIQQLYRRGANRVKYQVKSCIDSTCACKSFNTSPVGNASDCDGDGIVNSADNDDPYKAEFVGPGGNGATAFSELFNRDSGDMTFTCNANTTDSDNDICVNDEISLLGNPKASSPSFSFFDFPSSSRPLDNRYFQYRVLMEAEGNTACGGEPCLPELTSVEIGPSGRYFSGSPSVVNKTSQTLDKDLESLKVTNSSGCNMSYQISNDGNNSYYWDGASWVTGSDVSESNNLGTLNNNITSFTDQLDFGDFFFRSYLGNSNFSECELDEIQVIKSSQ